MTKFDITYDKSLAYLLTFAYPERKQNNFYYNIKIGIHIN